jgi:hypothetical protein
MMEIAALFVLLVVMLISVWALRRQPNAIADMAAIWERPWGKQIFVDFYGLEIVLVLWMASHAQDNGTWVAFGLSVVTMPFLGAMSAAAYWLFTVA